MRTFFGGGSTIIPRVTDNVTAASGGQSGATLLVGPDCVVRTANPGDGVQVNPASLGGRQRLFNRCGTDLLVYPSPGTAFESYGVNVPVTVINGDNAAFLWNGAVLWLAG